MATPLLSSESNLVGTLQIGIGTTTNTFTVIFKDKVTGNARTPQSTTKMFVIDKGSSTTPNPQYEIIYGNHTTTLGVTTFTGVERGLEFWGTSLTGVTARKKTHVAGAEVGVVDLHYYNDVILATLSGGGDPVIVTTYADHAARDLALPTPTDGMQIYVQSLEVFEQYRNGTWWLVSPVFADATQRDASIPVPVNGMKCYNIAVGLFQSYITGSWMNDGISSPTPNGSETVAGKFQEATRLQVGTSVQTGSTGADLVINPKDVVKVSSGAADENALVALNVLGKINAGFIDPLSTLVSYTSGEAIAANDVVYLNQTDQLLYRASTTNIGDEPIFGFAANTVAGSGLDVSVQTSGILTTTGLTAGTVYYNSGSAGALSSASPVINSSAVVPWSIGTAISTTQLSFSPRRIQRVIASDQILANTSVTNTITVGFKIKNVVVGGYLLQDSIFNITTNNYSTGYYDAISNTMYREGATGQVWAASAGSGGTTRSALITTALNASNLDYTYTRSGWGVCAAFVLFTIYELI